MRLLIGFVMLTTWLALGAAAAEDRGYFDEDGAVGCNFAGTAGLTVLAGPANYLIDPRVDCDEPRVDA